jgi:hypothetical protein
MPLTQHQRQRGNCRRRLHILGAAMLTSLALTPAAQAAPNDGHALTCATPDRDQIGLVTATPSATIDAVIGAGCRAALSEEVDSELSVDSSIDIETQKLTRMLDKRSQMFQMLESIIKKYDDDARAATVGIGR